MQEALPYKTWLPMPSRDNPVTSINKATSNIGNSASASVHYLRNAKRELKNTVEENAVIVFGKRGCCMSHVVKRLLQGLGANPRTYEVDEEDENDVINELERIVCGAGDGKEGKVQFPAVFVGGQLFGGLDRIMASHITGELTPILKKAGALWL